MSETKSKAVAKKQTAQAPAFMTPESAQGFTGFEQATHEAFAPAFLRVLQFQSPQVMEGTEDYVKGAKAGMFINTATSELLGKEVNFIPIMYEPCFIEWEPDGGAFRGKYTPQQAESLKHHQVGPRWKTEEGNDLMETHQFYGLLSENPEAGIVVFSLKSTGLKYSRKWMSRMGMLRARDGRAPMFSSVYHLRTALNTNDQGQKWFQIGSGSTLLIDRVGWITKDQYALVKQAIEVLNDSDLSGVYDASDDAETVEGAAEVPDDDGADTGF